MKFLFRKEKELHSSLYKILGFYPHNVHLYRLAFAHKSLKVRGDVKNKLYNNERLEFLGDAIIEAAISDIVFHHFDDKREGFLTITRSKLVQRDTLNKLSSELGLDDLLHAATRSSGHNSNLGGNAFEALVGAIYLDRGYTYSKWFLKKRILDQHIDIDKMAYKEVNFKSKLLEWCQKKRVVVDYQQDSDNVGKSCSPLFISSLFLEGTSISSGKGFSKKESQQNASKEALMRIKDDLQIKKEIYEARDKRLEALKAEANPKEKVAESTPDVSRNARYAPTK